MVVRKYLMKVDLRQRTIKLKYVGKWKKKCNEKSNIFKGNDQRETFYISPSFIKVKSKWLMLKNEGDIYEN